MRDLTRGSITGPLFQTLYFVVDLYWVARLGIAGVGAAGNTTFVVFALTQTLGVDMVALISQATGRKDAGEANLIFDQALSISVLMAAATLGG